jgi:hypothetical protein
LLRLRKGVVVLLVTVKIGRAIRGAVPTQH